MIISTDSTANLPQNYYKEKDIKMIPMQIYLDGEIYDDLSERLAPKEFYEKMKNGAFPKTAQINEEHAREYFEELLSSGEDVLHISFSTALSGNTSTMLKVAEEINKTSKNKLVVYDTLNASMGEGLFVLIANDLKNEGKTIDEIVAHLDSIKNNVCSYFTVEQLKYLVRGGRLGKFSGIVGSLLNIKPILHVDNEGRLTAFKKVISRKKSIAELAEICTNKLTDTKHIYITHTVCYDEALLLSNKIKELTGAEPIITDLTQVIGCHTGPGLLAIFFVGNEK